MNKGDLVKAGVQAWDDKKREIMNEPVIPASIRKETNPKDDAAAGTRVDLSLFPHTALVHGALAMTEGHLKYGGYNYRISGVKASVYIAALRRHTDKWEAGQNWDLKTLVHHLGSVIACASIIIDAEECGKLIDDRPPAVPDIDELFDRAEQITQHLHEIYPPEEGPGRFTEEGQREAKTNSPANSLHDSFSCGGNLSNSSGD